MGEGGTPTGISPRASKWLEMAQTSSILVSVISILLGTKLAHFLVYKIFKYTSSKL